MAVTNLLAHVSLSHLAGSLIFAVQLLLLTAFIGWLAVRSVRDRRRGGDGRWPWRGGEPL